jgi:vacuolar-type H+-ATPase subunit C/Vma6
MPGSGERAYVYAKACGIIGNSFVGKRFSRLGSLTRLSELDRLIFAQDARDLPERELLVDLERRIINRSAKQITTLVASFAKPPEFLGRLIRAYEYTDLKQVIGAVLAGERSAPAFTPLGRFGTINYDAYPHFPQMLKGTEFAFLLQDLASLPNIKIMDIQTKLDHHYYTGLWESLFELPRGDRQSIERILSEEISLRNASWALRMRTYYGMSAGEAREYLVCIPESRGAGLHCSSPTLADDALASLSLALDNHADWERWRWAKFLNPSRPGEPWAANPRHFQNAAAGRLARLARHFFRLRPLSLDTASCFIKLKQFEEDILISLAEGLSLGMAAPDILAVLEAAS